MNEYLMWFVVGSVAIIDTLLVIAMIIMHNQKPEDKDVKQGDFLHWQKYFNERMDIRVAAEDLLSNKINMLYEKLGYEFVPNSWATKHVPAHVVKVSKKK